MKSFLTTQQQLEVVREAKRQFKMHHCHTGLCAQLVSVLDEKHTTRRIWHAQVCYCIPLFRRENAIRHCCAITSGAYWWSTENREIRIIFLQWIENQLIKELKITNTQLILF